MVPGAVEACGQRGIKAAVVISGGFREVGAEGAAREREMVEIAAALRHAGHGAERHRRD